jgi:hypothetical protein
MHVLDLCFLRAGGPLQGVNLKVEVAGQDADHVWVLESHQGQPVLKRPSPHANKEKMIGSIIVKPSYAQFLLLHDSGLAAASQNGTGTYVNHFKTE